jgi:hypothetical protein
MNQVEGGLASREVPGKRRSVREIGFEDLYTRVPSPLPARQFPGRPDQTADPVSVAEQTRSETPSNVAGSPGNRDASWS